MSIDKYLRGLPYAVREPLTREYEAKARELARWAERSRSGRMRNYLNQASTIRELIALGVYYRHIIAPLEGSAQFMEMLQRTADVTRVKVGGKEITPEFRLRIERGVSAFHSMTRSFGLPSRLFAESDVGRFVMALVRLEIRAAAATSPRDDG